ncbi:MAG: hypothetical protein LBV45_06990 [Xanthomonadaceae bacterium]|jgi:hypothetical protein|nr:hypothetical protein [Xanthomonadaceae bacterium]
MIVRYLIRLPNPEKARGKDPGLSFTAFGADEFAEQLQAALRTDKLFQIWRNAQDDPDKVNLALGLTDPQATVIGEQEDLHIDLTITTSLAGDILRHRLDLLAGSNQWQLRRVQ